MQHIGLVIIGRNEGERLKCCLQSILDQADKIVYVDSGSSDGSVEYAESIGVEVVQLNMRVPFSAGRARNEGFRHLTKKHVHIQYIQFIDGDCKLCDDWLDFARRFLEKNDTCAIVTGRRKEKFPENSIYNLLCDIEWNTSLGEVKECGGDFMIRRVAFQQVDGFNPAVIAGEEPEMCYRLRKNNWSIFRLDHPMTMHDAAITRFSQWWKRYVRTGHAYAQGYVLHKPDRQGYCFRESAKIWFWAFIFPAFIIISTLSVSITFLFLLAVYLIQLAKIAIYEYPRLRNIKHSAIYSFFTVIGKWPQLWGQLLFIKRKLTGTEYSIIEYN